MVVESLLAEHSFRGGLVKASIAQYLSMAPEATLVGCPIADEVFRN